MAVRNTLGMTGPALVFVTTTVDKWLPVFSHPQAAEIALDELGKSLEYQRVSLVGYVLMPSHLHALLGFPAVEKLSKFMQSFKILSSKRMKELSLGRLSHGLRARGRYRLWKPRFDDLVITSDKQFRIKLKYIHENPERAGLIRGDEHWPYSSASDWLQDRPGRLRIDKEYCWTV